jgi:hypothetical protein
MLKEAAVHDQFSSSNDTQFSSAVALILNGFDQNTMIEAAPDPKQIAHDVANVDFQLDGAPNTLLVGPNTIQMTEPGVPVSMCRSNLWKPRLTKPSIANATIAMQSAEFSDPVVKTDTGSDWTVQGPQAVPQTTPANH